MTTASANRRTRTRIQQQYPGPGGGGGGRVKIIQWLASYPGPFPPICLGIGLYFLPLFNFSLYMYSSLFVCLEHFYRSTIYLDKMLSFIQGGPRVQGSTVHNPGHVLRIQRTLSVSVSVLLHALCPQLYSPNYNKANHLCFHSTSIIC